MSSATQQRTDIIKRAPRPTLLGKVRIVMPFPSEAYYHLYKWSLPVWDMVADDYASKDPEAFVEYQESMDSKENVLTWGVYRGHELGGIIKFVIDPMRPWMGDGHCLFKKDFWGRETTAVAVVLAFKEVFEHRGIKKINMGTFKRNHAIGALMRFVGAKREAELRRVTLQHGKLIDNVVWGITPEDLSDAFEFRSDLKSLMESN